MENKKKKSPTFAIVVILLILFAGTTGWLFNDNQKLRKENKSLEQTIEKKEFREQFPEKKSWEGNCAGC